MRAPGELLGALAGSSGAKMGARRCKKTILKILVATSNLKKHKKSFQEAPKSAQNEAKRAPEESKEHLYIPNLDLSKIELPLYEMKVFEGGRVSLRAQNRHQEAPR